MRGVAWVRKASQEMPAIRMPRIAPSAMSTRRALTPSGRRNAPTVAEAAAMPVGDAVGASGRPEGVNARRVLMAEGAILGILIAGISWLAYRTHATPRVAGYPTVLAQEAQLVFGSTFI